MMNQLELDEYKQTIADSYDWRSQTYDESEWHVQICHRLIEYSQVCEGQTVLDIGTGTAHLAIAAAQRVGDRGQVIGIDISSRMLEKASAKVNRLGLKNIAFQLADAEALDYPANTFDHIQCANTFPWLNNKESTLRSWFLFLKPGGRISIHTPADTAYAGAVVLRQILANHGILLEASNRIGSVEQCEKMMAHAGFEAIETKTEQHGSYISLAKANASWESIVVNPSALSLKAVGPELSQLSSIQLLKIKTEFDAKLESLQSDRGLWDDLTTLYILAQKP